MTILGKRSLCFFVERLRTESAPDAERRLSEIVELNGLISLRIRHHLVTTAAGVRPDALIFEPLPGRPVATVRMTVDDDDAVVRVNGELVGTTCELHVRDVVECVGDPVALHLSMIHRPYVGPVAAEHVGRMCAVCKVPITAGPIAAGPAIGDLPSESSPGEGPPGEGPPSEAEAEPGEQPLEALVLECVSCGAVLHERVPDESEGGWLECAKSVHACPVCETPIQREESYVYVPGLA
jgi:hypothetical protein